MAINRKLKIGTLDALVVFKPDGTYETSLPTIAGDDVPEHMVTTAAISYALQDPELMDMIFDNFDKQCQLLKEPATLSLFPALKS